jgi:hypothetical protein
MRTSAKCAECGRVFDLLDEDDAAEWSYGHDCETVPQGLVFVEASLDDVDYACWLQRHAIPGRGR